MKLEVITSAVLHQLTVSCTECGVTSAFIDTPSFACFSESPTSVTYRTRLLGTSETDSGSLISLIEEWVSGGAGIIMTGVLVTVDSECPVAISSLGEGECQQPPTTEPISDSEVITPDPTSDPVTDSTPSTTDNTAAIIGGSVVTVVLIITVALTIAVVTITFFLKNRCGNNTSINKQKE